MGGGGEPRNCTKTYRGGVFFKEHTYAHELFKNRNPTIFPTFRIGFMLEKRVGQASRTQHIFDSRLINDGDVGGALAGLSSFGK